MVQYSYKMFVKILCNTLHFQEVKVVMWCLKDIQLYKNNRLCCEWTRRDCEKPYNNITFRNAMS